MVLLSRSIRGSLMEWWHDQNKNWYVIHAKRKRSIGSHDLCDRVADLLAKWGFCFAVLGFELANIRDNVLLERIVILDEFVKSKNLSWSCLIKFAIRKILLVYEKKRELASILLSWKENTQRGWAILSQLAWGSEVKAHWTICAKVE